MRLFLALLLCLALPLQGWGGGLRQQPPCPMEAAMAMQGDLFHAGPVMAVDDCCNDAETFQLTGKMCKTGQECQAPTGFVAPPVMALAQTLPVSELHAPALPEPLRGSPANIWRPPSLL
ncbi:hypothetical protein [Malikia spinosa]|jgi:hypothetical protein|uniref:Uncharacterized protein n=1 Tax=Malikia spinosa TaxID=86180 RepID=A0A7C9MWY6_9BURK|nr:hypothetical protein [Malikia spinosa]MYZ53336.1 hypothetical protein [Malikia spinosa]